jgi:hypothetical protein
MFKSRVKLHTLVLFTCLLTGCADMVEKGRASTACKEYAGPQPYQWAYNFGAVGAIAASQTDESQAWGKRYGDCMAGWQTSRDAPQK